MIKTITRIFKIQNIIALVIIFILALILTGCSAPPSDVVINADASQLVLNVNDFPLGWGITKEATESGYYSRYFSTTDSSLFAIYSSKSLICRIRVFKTIDQAKNEYNNLLASVKYSYSKMDIGEEGIAFQSNNYYCTRFRVANVTGFADMGISFYQTTSLDEAKDWAGKSVNKMQKIQRSQGTSIINENQTTEPAPPMSPSNSPISINNILFQDEFTAFDSTKWVDATYLPLFSGRPQTINQTSVDGRTALYMETDENPSNMRRGIGSVATIDIEPKMVVEMAFKPVGDLDGICELWVFNQATSKYVRISAFAGNYGKTRAVSCEVSGYDIKWSPYQDSQAFSWNEWLIFRIETNESKTTLSLLDENRNTKWNTYYNTPLSSIFNNCNIAISQNLGTPSSGTWQMKSYIDYIRVIKGN